MPGYQAIVNFQIRSKSFKKFLGRLKGYIVNARISVKILSPWSPNYARYRINTHYICEWLPSYAFCEFVCSIGRSSLSVVPMV